MCYSTRKNVKKPILQEPLHVAGNQEPLHVAGNQEPPHVADEVDEGAAAGLDAAGPAVVVSKKSVAVVAATDSGIERADKTAADHTYGALDALDAGLHSNYVGNWRHYGS